MIGNAHGDSVEAGRRQVGNAAFGRFGENKRQWPRPERFGQSCRLGVETRQRLRRLEIDHVGDERVERRAPLGCIEASDGAAIGGVSTEAVDSLGRKRHQAAGGEHARGFGNGSGIGLQNARRQRGCHLSPPAPR